MSLAANAKLMVERWKASSNISKGASEKHLGEEGRKLFMDEDCPTQSSRVESSVCLMISTKSRENDLSPSPYLTDRANPKIPIKQYASSSFFLAAL